MFFSCFLLHLHSYDNIVQTDAAKMFENTAVCMPGQEVVLYCVLQVNIAMLKVYTNSKVCVSSPPQRCLREIVQTQQRFNVFCNNKNMLSCEQPQESERGLGRPSQKTEIPAGQGTIQLVPELTPLIFLRQSEKTMETELLETQLREKLMGGRRCTETEMRGEYSLFVCVLTCF